MSTESLDTAGDPLQVPLLSVVTKPSKPDRYVENGWVGESDTFWRESLIATLCFFPLGLIALCASLEVMRWNNEGNFGRAQRASRAAGSLVKFTFRFSVVLYLILGLLVLGLIEAGIVFGIDKAHTSGG